MKKCGNHRGALALLVLAGCSAQVGGGAPGEVQNGVDASGGARGPEGGIPDGGAGGTADDARPSTDGASLHPELLPIVLLDVDDQSPDSLPETKVSGRFRLVVEHDGTLLDLARRPAAIESWMGISLRGSSSRAYAQKSYGIELRDATGGERKVSLLGMAADSDWGLVPCYQDRTCMRNALAYGIGQGLGRWSPHLRFVEVIFNGVYWGLYQVVELPRASRNRLAFTKPAGNSGAGDITGTYLISREGAGKAYPTTVPPLDWLSPVKAPDDWGHQIIYSYRIPDPDEMTDAQRKYIQDHMARFEEMMKSATWADPSQGYRAWIDVPSWVDAAIMNELSNNVDGYWKSMYMMKEPDPPGGRGKLFQEPPWDFNLGYGNAGYREGWRTDKLNLKVLIDDGSGGCAYTDWLPQGPPLCGPNCCNRKTCKLPEKCWNIPIVPFYWERLWSDRFFRDALKCRWQALRKPGQPLSSGVIEGAIAEWMSAIGPLAILRHFTRWPDVVGNVGPDYSMYDPTFVPRTSATVAAYFPDEVAWMRAWLERRLAFLDANLPGTCAPQAGVQP